MTAETTTKATDDAQEPQEGTEAPKADLEAPEPAQDDDNGQNDDGPDHPAAEAKRYRLRLRETEAERDALAARLETMQRAEVERIASREVQNPAAIWAAGTTVADVLDDQGNIDPDKVKAVTVAAAETLGLARPLTNHAPFAGQTPANRPRGGMADVIRGEQ